MADAIKIRLKKRLNGRFSMNSEPLNVKGNSRKSKQGEIIHLFLGENPVESGVPLCMK